MKNCKIEFVHLRLQERSIWDRIFKRMKWPEYWIVNKTHGVKFRSSKTEGYYLLFAEYINDEDDLPAWYYLLDYNGREVRWYRGTMLKGDLSITDGGSYPYNDVRNKKTGQVLGGYDIILRIREEKSRDS